MKNEKRNLSYIAITAVAAAIIKLGLVEETFQKNKDKYFFVGSLFTLLLFMWSDVCEWVWVSEWMNRWVSIKINYV